MKKHDWLEKQKVKTVNAWLQLAATYQEWKSNPCIKVFFHLARLFAEVAMSALAKKLFDWLITLK